MNRNVSMPVYTLLVATSAVLICLPLSANAGARIWDNTVSTCTALNCSSLVISGTVTNPEGNVDPFTIEALAGAGECVRFDVTSASQDLKMVVVASNGAVYRDDDSGGGLNPLVRIGSAPRRGWYTVHLAHWAGAAVYADFIMRYGRYNSGNPNCQPQTPPAISAGQLEADEASKPQSFGQSELDVNAAALGEGSASPDSTEIK